MTSEPALKTAINVYNFPPLVRTVRSRPLAGDVTFVLQIVAGDCDALRAAVLTTERSPGTIVAASTFFVEQILFAPESDCYRILGADKTAQRTLLRGNMALLLKWLHPDFGTDDIKARYAANVTVAWNSLKTADRRLVYDQQQSLLLKPARSAARCDRATFVWRMWSLAAPGRKAIE